MNPPIVSRDLVAEKLTVSTSTLLRLEGRGLVRAVRDGDVEGYGPAEIRRVWTILSFHRDLGVNLAGVEVILRLRDQIESAQARLAGLSKALLEALDERDSDA